jgi:hypothetical protein
MGIERSNWACFFCHAPDAPISPDAEDPSHASAEILRIVEQRHRAKKDTGGEAAEDAPTVAPDGAAINLQHVPLLGYECYA